MLQEDSCFNLFLVVRKLFSTEFEVCRQDIFAHLAIYISLAPALPAPMPSWRLPARPSPPL
jgi:hypothetical protein